MQTRRIVSIAALLLLAASPLLAANAQTKGTTAKAVKPKTASNVKVLKDLSPVELQHAMSLIRASLGVGCDFCHVQKDGEWDFPSDAKDEKQTAREMMLMVKQMNLSNFDGLPVVGCYTCHRGSPRPTSMPPLPQPLPAPPATGTRTVDRSTFPEAAALVGAYLKATGLDDPAHAKMTTRVLRGTRTDATGVSAPIELVQSGGRLLSTTTMPRGDVQQSCDGTKGWVKDDQGVRAMSALEVARFVELTRSLDLPRPDPKAAGYRVVGKDKVDDREVWVVDRKLEGGVSERFSFDAETGLLLRLVRISPLPIGRLPEQVFYNDYRDVAGMKVAYVIKSDFVDARLGSVRKFETIDYAARVDPTRFEMPGAK